MNSRDKSYKQTEQKLRVAIQNIRDGKLTSPELIEKTKAGKTVKLNKQNVEIEAGKGNGLIRKYYKHIEREIDAIVTATANPLGDISSHPEYIKLVEKNHSLKEKNKTLTKQNKCLLAEVSNKDTVIEKDLTEVNNMLAALWEAIPTSERQARMRAAHQLAEIVHISKNKKDD
ncbi:hypothetical protein [Pseudoalteromonas sp. P1-25]|uniref:hypothetical protein n=1 Tax=Pseudoalteromonas sp. P1-25 TaxID=1723758 RepID=UPI0006D65EAB|nr:hypothetical protein [Pseudoalteromonas sp. P1-25]KPZ57968.1 hypothetical protein AN393_00562 [Pseudoalteromonas sp. P1-25]